MAESLKYFLGCPVWACDGWKGRLFPSHSPRKEWLARYSAIFSTVEGNTTFYALPTIEKIQKWASETDESFRFALKFPKAITHDRRLVGCQYELEHFIECLDILGDAEKLGPSFVQLPPDFGVNEFAILAKFLQNLPRDYPFAVEVRNPAFFAEPFEDELNQLLTELGMDRVHFDSRPLFHFPPSDVTEVAARGRKPKVPLRKNATGEHPFLRLIGVNKVEKVLPWIDEWTDVVALWMSEGKQPFVFTHTPNDEFAPEMARLFHNKLAEKVVDLRSLQFDVDEGDNQLSLFEME